MLGEKVLTIIPLAGMVTTENAQNIPLNSSPDMYNWQVYGGYLRKRPGYAKYVSGGTFPSTAITGVFSAKDAAGTRRLFTTTRAGLFKYNVGTTNWDAMTGPALTGQDTDLFSFEISQNGLVFSQGVDNIMLLPLTTTNYAALSANSKPSHFLARFINRLYAAFTLEGGNKEPFRVRWPISGDHTDWTGLGSGFNDLNEPVPTIQNIRKIQEALGVYTDNGIWLASKTGQLLLPAQYDRVVSDVRLASPMTLQGWNVIHYFVGGDNFYTFNGVACTPVLNAVREYVYSKLSASGVAQNFAFIMSDTQEYVAFIATGGNTTPDTAWVYNWARNAAYPWLFTSLFTCATTHFLDSGVTIAQLQGTIAAQGWIIGASQLTANFPLPILGATSGKLYQLSTAYLSDDGVAIPCRWTSKDFTAVDIDPKAAGHMVSIKNVGFSYMDLGTAVTFNFYYSIDRGTTWSGPYPVTVGGTSPNVIGDAMATQLVTGKRVRFKVENAGLNEAPGLVAFYPHLVAEDQLIA